MGRTYVVVRVADDDITDWRGRLLDGTIRAAFHAGNIVRIQLAEPEPVHVGWVTTPYVRITHVDASKLIGTVDDPYGTDDEIIANGDVVAFTRGDVIEIPLDWDGNENLAAIAVHTGGVRGTGMR